MTEEQEKADTLVAEILRVERELRAFYPTGKTIARGAPASPQGLAALAEHWGHALPPSYRAVLEVNDGVSSFWARLPLHSTSEIIGGAYEIETFEEITGELWRWVVVCDDEDSDAVVLDFSKVGDDGEAEVVTFHIDGEAERFPDFFAFMASYLAQMKAELERERSDRANLKDD